MRDERATRRASTGAEISVGRGSVEGTRAGSLRPQAERDTSTAPAPAPARQHSNTSTQLPLALSLSRSHHSTVAQRHRAPPTPPRLDRLHSQAAVLSLDQSMPKDPGARRKRRAVSMPDKGKRRPPWAEQPVGGPRCETHSSANRRFQRIPRPSISTHRARSLASGQLGCARLPASLAAMPAGMRGALWFSWGLHWRCIMRFTYSSGASVLFGSCLVARQVDDPRRPWRRSRTWPASGLAQWADWQRMFQQVWLPRSRCPGRTAAVDRSLMGCSEAAGAFAASLPACQPACQALEHPSLKLPPKLAEFDSKARLPLGGGHRPSHAPISASPHSSVFPVTPSNLIWQSAILCLATRPL